MIGRKLLYCLLKFLLATIIFRRSMHSSSVFECTQLRRTVQYSSCLVMGTISNLQLWTGLLLHAKDAPSLAFPAPFFLNVLWFPTLLLLTPIWFALQFCLPFLSALALPFGRLIDCSTSFSRSRCTIQKRMGYWKPRSALPMRWLCLATMCLSGSQVSAFHAHGLSNIDIPALSVSRREGYTPRYFLPFRKPPWIFDPSIVLATSNLENEFFNPDLLDQLFPVREPIQYPTPGPVLHLTGYASDWEVYMATKMLHRSATDTSEVPTDTWSVDDLLTFRSQRVPYKIPYHGISDALQQELLKLPTKPICLTTKAPYFLNEQHVL